MGRRKRVKNPKGPGGRLPGSKQLKDVEKQALHAVREGLPLRRIPDLIGVKPTAWWDWLAKGRDGEPEYVEFSEAVYCARELLCLELVPKAIAGDQGAQWMLIYSFGFTKTERVEVVDARERTNEEIDEWLEEHKAMVQDGDEQRVH